MLVHEMAPRRCAACNPSNACCRYDLHDVLFGHQSDHHARLNGHLHALLRSALLRVQIQA